MITEFRQKVCAEIGIVPLEHQQRWWSLADGQILLPEAYADLPTCTVKMPDESIEVRSLAPRPGGRAKVIAELAAYKGGKSFGAALWATGFASVPQARVYLVGIEYDTCAPEFEYLLEFLISDRGLHLPYANLQNRPKDGRLWLELENGARFEARSWERSESLKGKEVDAYIFCEAYQLPGIECFMSVKQNLRARHGYAVFPTTPDSPWIATLHKHGHGDPDYPEWACQCSIPASVNPYTYDAKMEGLDQRLMTKEKYNIAYLGRIGSYIGRVYSYQLGERQFNTSTHPDLWYDPSKPAEPRNLKIPPGWEIVIGADTGTYFGAVIMAFDEAGDAFVIDELANYRYVAQTIELDPDLSSATWAERFKAKAAIWGARPTAWVDSNSQFKQEFWNQYGITLRGNYMGREARTESARQYFQHDKIWLAPWLDLLPSEIESAAWPEGATSSGKFERVKHNDHLLDGLEHICSKRPRGKLPGPPASKPYYEEWHRPRTNRTFDPHLGSG